MKPMRARPPFGQWSPHVAPGSFHVKGEVKGAPETNSHDLLSIYISDTLQGKK